MNKWRQYINKRLCRYINKWRRYIRNSHADTDKHGANTSTNGYADT